MSFQYQMQYWWKSLKFQMFCWSEARNAAQRHWSQCCPNIPISRLLKMNLTFMITKKGRSKITYLILICYNMSAVLFLLIFHSLNYYLDFVQETFPRSNESEPVKVFIEKTPNYLVQPLVPLKVKEINCKMKMLVILRDPFDRLVSDFLLSERNAKKRNREFCLKIFWVFIWTEFGAVMSYNIP